MSDDIYIKVTKDGPYLVYGGVPVSIETIATNDDGGSWEWNSGKTFEVDGKYALCRCGHSSTKPFCDGTHRKRNFDGTETASRDPYESQAQVAEGPTMTLLDAGSLCAYARFCDVAGSIWSLIERDDDDSRELVRREAAHCPSGRLVIRDKQTGRTIEPEYAPSITLVEDPAQHCSGPLWVRGNIRIEAADGTSYEVRNRVTLCRCGESKNKPFCDGAHAETKFSDGLF
jgi:CDGSH-type Zn-finger protein